MSEWDATAYNRLNNPLQSGGEAMVERLEQAAVGEPECDAGPRERSEIHALRAVPRQE